MRIRQAFGTLDPFFEGGDVMGRKVANAAFLRALLELDPFEAYHFYPSTEAMAEAMRRDLAQERPDLLASGRALILRRQELPARLAAGGHHCFHLSDCLLSQPHLSRLRNLHAPECFPVSGGIHSLSRADTPLAMLQHLWPGATPRDAVICTSEAGQAAVEAMFAALRQGLGLDPEGWPGPHLARIPLGIDAASLRPARLEERAEARRMLGAAEEECVFLCLGRLEHHSKMDLLPLLRAFQRAMAQELGPVRLVLAGWGARDDEVLATVRGLAGALRLPLDAFLCPDEADKRRLLAAADVFVSPSDNVQETFGLTLLEAGAAGLPVLAGDWDGYRDIVAHGETGLLAPTVGPALTGSVDALARLLPDNQYHLLLAQRTALDVAALADGLLRLSGDAGLRARLGAAARRRVEERFTWQAVVRAHLDLWEDLWRKPAQLRPEAAHPLHLRFARAFAAHPAQRGLAGLRLIASRTGEACRRGQEQPLIYAGVAHIVTPERLRAVLTLARKAADGEDVALRLAAADPSLDAEGAEFLVLWALKHGFVERA